MDAGGVESQAGQMAQLTRATGSLAALTQQLHQLSTNGRHRTGDQNGHRAALSFESKRQHRDTERIMAKLQPHLDQAEQRLTERLDQVAVDHEARKGDKAGTAESRDAQRSSQTESHDLPINRQTISGRVDDYIGDLQIDPSDPTWVRRTGFREEH